MTQDQAHSLVANYPLLDALRLRRSRRFGVGMEMNAGPLAFRSQATPLRLSEHEETLLAFAACGATGPALGDLVYSEGAAPSWPVSWAARSPAATSLAACSKQQARLLFLMYLLGGRNY